MAITPANSFTSRCTILVVMCVITAMSWQPTFAQLPDETSAQQSENTSDDDSPEKKKQKRLVEVGFILLVGIGMLGGLLIVITLVLGFYSRRRVQTGKKEPTRFDPFWYLRTNPKANDDQPNKAVEHLPPDADDDD